MSSIMYVLHVPSPFVKESAEKIRHIDVLCATAKNMSGFSLKEDCHQSIHRDVYDFTIYSFLGAHCGMDDREPHIIVVVRYLFYSRYLHAEHSL